MVVTTEHGWDGCDRISAERMAEVVVAGSDAIVTANQSRTWYQAVPPTACRPVVLRQSCHGHYGYCEWLWGYEFDGSGLLERKGGWIGATSQA